MKTDLYINIVYRLCQVLLLFAIPYYNDTNTYKITVLSTAQQKQATASKSQSNQQAKHKATSKQTQAINTTTAAAADTNAAPAHPAASTQAHSPDSRRFRAAGPEGCLPVKVLRTTKRLYIILVFGIGLTVMIVGKSNQLPLGPPPITSDCLYGCFLPTI